MNNQQPTTNNQRLKRKAVTVSCATLALTFLFSGCQKEEAISTVGPTALVEENVTPRVSAFILKASSNAQERNDVNYSLDSAEWYVEAGLNLELAEAWKHYNENRTDSIILPITITDGTIQEDAVYAAYNAFHNVLATVPQEGVQHLIVADVLISQNGSYSLMKLYYTIGSGYAKLALNTTYGPNAFFLWHSVPGNNNAGCGSNNGGAGKAADKQIQDRVNVAIPLLPINCYWTNVQNLIAQGEPYMYFCPLGNSCTLCFTPSMMSTYTQGTWDLLQLYKPVGKLPISVTVEGVFTLNSPNNLYGHLGTFTYGKKQCGFCC